MKSHHIKFQKILAVLLAILALVGGLFGLCRAVASARAYDIAPLTDERLAELDLTGITHLMIVAHPDDETLWGGAHIADGGYLVVCITNGYNATRSAEFQAVMQASNNVGLILSYPYIAGQTGIGDGSIRLVGMLPGPLAGAFAGLRQLAVFFLHLLNRMCTYCILVYRHRGSANCQIEYFRIIGIRR